MESYIVVLNAYGIIDQVVSKPMNKTKAMKKAKKYNEDCGLYNTESYSIKLYKK